MSVAGRLHAWRHRGVGNAAPGGDGAGHALGQRAARAGDGGDGPGDGAGGEHIALAIDPGEGAQVDVLAEFVGADDFEDGLGQALVGQVVVHAHDAHGEVEAV